MVSQFFKFSRTVTAAGSPAGVDGTDRAEALTYAVSELGLGTGRGRSTPSGRWFHGWNFIALIRRLR